MIKIYIANANINVLCWNIYHAVLISFARAALPQLLYGLSIDYIILKYCVYLFNSQRLFF